jgi:PBSX family phage terminase large subunit
MVAMLTRPNETYIDYQPRGASRSVMTCRDKEVLIEGPAGTGKSFGNLQKLHLCMQKYPGARGLIIRKTLESLKDSALNTFQERVLDDSDGVVFYGGSKAKSAAFIYPNGSQILVGGMDKPTKIMSSEFDIVVVVEATEFSENDIEMITTRLRYGMMPYQQLLMDCNPEAPSHWLNIRCKQGKTTRLVSRHEDNPALWDAARQAWTQRGTEYIATLDALTGVRRDRLRYGRWVAAEGAVFAFDRAVHVIDHSPFVDGNTPRSVGAGVDWGYTHPGVIEVGQLDGDGRITVPRIVYRTGTTIDWWIDTARDLKARYGIEWFACDPSEPAYIEQFNQAGLHAFAAQNAILPGIDAVQQRLAVAGDGRPRLQFMADCLPDPDPALVEAKKPLSTLDEFDVYVWSKASGAKEKPVDADNHGMDTTRYLVMEFDNGTANGWDHLTPDDLARIWGGR